MKPLVGKIAQKRAGWPRKKHAKQLEEREWRKDYTDEELYPELEDDE